ncbi:arylsulfatase [Edaphobacter aggregans]|uniref:arylsulfatase n=1 Tax=Edaphobacter aggregans TaxID=570835 RepID=UPI00068CA75F|nr:arylsulfatase [Edaphobacter aggregans]
MLNSRSRRTRINALVVSAAICLVSPILAAQTAQPKMGDVLPIEPPKQAPITEIDRKKVPPPKLFQVTPPKGAPNVVIILMDQLSYADPDAMGGPIKTPAFDELAKTGLLYTNFHVNALCSPTRFSLLTGRNQHLVSGATVVDSSTSYPGDTGRRPDNVATIAEIVRRWGYVTGYFGKSHELPPYEYNVSGPFDRWPAHSGWDKFYGYLAGEQSSLAPNLVDGTTRLPTPHGDPNYHFNTDMTNKAIAWVQATRSLTPDRPFLMYYSSSGGHPPHTPPKDWLDKGLYKGDFNQGWDQLRVEILERQKKLGIVPPDTKLAENPEFITRWHTLSSDAKKVLSRQMEVYATLVESADYQVGRLIQTLKDLDIYDNTLIFYIAGDNGGSSIGDINGTFNEWSALNGAPEDIPYLLSRLDDYGGPKSYPNYSVAWAVAGSAPATWCIQMPFGGGNNAGMAVHWPKGIKDPGTMRRQYSSVIDIAPTVLQVAGIPEPKVVNGAKQMPMSGTSLMYTFNDPTAKGRHETQYNEIKGNRMIYHDGWEAITVHITPWSQVPEHADYATEKWHLYHVADDFGMATDVAAKYPQKLVELKALWLNEAKKNNVLPLDDRAFERLNPVVAGRPDLMFGRTTLTLYPGMTNMTENGFINTKGVDYTISAELEIPKGGANGVILSQAGQMGGWSLYVKDGKPKYAYNWLARNTYTISGNDPLPEGKVNVTFKFDYDGGGLNKGATGTLFVNGKRSAKDVSTTQWEQSTHLQAKQRMLA